MKKILSKSGFVFIETLIVVSILAVSLIVVYRAFSTSISNEKKRMSHDNTVYLYRTFYIKKYLEANGLDNYIDYLKTNDVLVQNIVCGFRIKDETKTFCELLIQKNDSIGVSQVYIIKNNIKDLFKAENATELNNFSPGAIDYLKTIGNLETNEYLLFVEYKERTDRKLDETSDIYIYNYNYASLVVSGG